ncbi:MAG: acetylglutamate kinase [Alphaproteobacteria bacterium]
MPKPDQSLYEKAQLLADALPYMHKYAGETLVIKYGGHAMIDPTLSRLFAREVALMKQVGMNPVVVHGGGPQIAALLKRLNIESEFIHGQRVTDAPTMEVVEMVLAGRINKQIVSDIIAAGAKAIGLSGRDASLITARKLIETVDGKPVDLGFVGEPDIIDPAILNEIADTDFIPVIAPVASDADGQSYNINADTVAGAIAAALSARRLMMMTDVDGVLDKDKNLIAEMDKAQAEAMIADGTIAGGMIPKIRTCLNAVDGGVRGAVIIDGRQPYAVTLEIFTEGGAGTLIRA